MKVNREWRCTERTDRDHRDELSQILFPISFLQPSRRFRVASCLQDFIENVAVLIDGAPQPVNLATDGDPDLVQRPHITGSGALAA